MPIAQERGFTLIELLMAMAVFGFMLLIVVTGFINVVRIHNAALASNAAQDSARAAMDLLVQAVRDSTGVASMQTGVAPGLGSANYDVMCLQNSTSVDQLYYVTGAPAQLVRADNCAAPTNVQPLTSDTQAVSQFKAVQQTSGPGIVKPEVQLTITLGSSNGTTSGSGGLVINGGTFACNNNNADRAFCSTASLTSGAEPR